MFEISNFNTLIFLNLDLSSSNFSTFVPDAKIFALQSFNLLTIELPIPPDAPVTIIFLFLRSIICSNLLYHSHY